MLLEWKYVRKKMFINYIKLMNKMNYENEENNYCNLLQKLKGYFFSKERKSYDPLKFNNTPFQIGEVMMYFINHADIDNFMENAIDLFPLLKQGYCLRTTLYYIMFCHIYNNNLNDDKFFIPDQLFNKTFAADLPSLFLRNNHEKVENNSRINTFDAIKQYRTDFDQKIIETYYIQSICFLNYIKREDLYDLNSEFNQQLITENKLMKEFYQISRTNKK